MIDWYIGGSDVNSDWLKRIDNGRYQQADLAACDAALALLRSQSPPETKKAPDLTPAERALIARLEAAFAAELDAAAAAVARGEPPDLDRLNAALTDMLAEALAEQFSTTAIGYGADAASQGAAWVRQYTPELIKGLTETTMTLVQQVITEARATPGITLADIAVRLAPAFGPARADVIATTELTRAAAQATRASQEYLRGNGVDMVMVWRTNHDERVCPICNPRNGLMQGDGWENPPPAHPRCRCSVTLTRRGL